jgi:predicted ATPase/Tfp pilus assembly protein PilF/DNA-binding SARP family transcriptional activator
MTTPRLQLLGRACLHHGGSIHDLPDVLPASLLAYLGARGDWVTREELAALFWPDAAPEDAQRSLRVSLNRLREKLQAWGAEAALESERRRVRWQPGSDVSAARAARAQGQWPSLAQQLAGQPFAGGLSFRGLPVVLEWADGERRALQALAREAVLRCAASLPPAALLALSGRHLATDPDDEEVRKVHLQALGTLGRHDEAARAHAADDGLVGRDDDLAQARALLARHGRLTLTGLGGVGKTRLARALAADAAHVLWLPLQDLSRVAELPYRAWQLLGQTAAPGRDVAGQVAWQLAQQRAALLVLDNAEHLLGQRAELQALLAGWLQAAPGLRLLVTSRERLGGPDEPVLALRALALPTGAADVLAAPALRLLAAEARRARPGFDAREHRAALAGIARQTGGLPLALHIAAQWLRMLNPADVLAALQRSPTALDGGGADSLGASLWRSWQLLDEAPQQALAALALFVSPFTAEDARQAGAAELPVLMQLVDLGLVETLPAETTGAAPLQLHALVRAFAAERAAEKPAVQRQQQARHADALRRRLAPFAQWRTIDQGLALRTLAAMFEELRAAWHWALAHGRSDFIAEVAPVLCHFFEKQGRWAEGGALFQAAEAAFDAGERSELAALAALTRSRALLLYRDGRFEAAAELAQRSLAWTRHLAHGEGTRGNLNTLALSRWMLGQLDAALTAATEAHDTAQAAGDHAEQAMFAGTLALLYKKQGRYAEAEACWRGALAVHREVGNWSSAVVTLNNLGNLLRTQGRPDDAVAVLEEALRLSDAYGFASSRPYSLINLALAHMAAGRPAAAEPLAQRALDETRRAGERMLEAAAQLALAEMACRDGRLGLAAARLAPALKQAHAIGDQANLLEALSGYARWCLARLQTAQAAQARATVLAHPALHAELRAELLAEPALPPAAPVDLVVLVEQAGAELAAAATP